jgi:hypothetical protein
LAQFPNQDPRWPDKSHFAADMKPPTGETAKRCQAWKSDRSAQCSKIAAHGYHVCASHGAAGIKANARIQTRKEFQSALAEYENEEGIQINAKVIEVLANLATKQSNLDAIKYWCDQQFGSPKTTIVKQVDAELMAKIGEIFGELLPPDKLEAGLARLSELAFD